MGQTSGQAGDLKPWSKPTLGNYSFSRILLKPFESMQFKPWCTGAGRPRKTFIADSTFMHHMCSAAGVPEDGWVSVGVHIDGYPIARVLGKNAGSFAGGGDALARQAFSGMRFKSA